MKICKSNALASAELSTTDAAFSANLTTASQSATENIKVSFSLEKIFKCYSQIAKTIVLVEKTAKKDASTATILFAW